MREILFDPRRAAAAAGMETTHHKGPADRRFLDVKPVDIELVVVLRIGDRRLQHLLHIVGDAPTAESELGDRRLRGLAADHRRDQVELARADADRALEGRRLIVGEPALGGWLAHQPLLARLSPAWP